MRENVRDAPEMQASIKTLAIRAATPDELNEQVAEALEL